MDDLRYEAGWVPAMAPGPDPDETDSYYAREPITVQCADCGEDVLVESASYDDLNHEWVCDNCLGDEE